MRNRLAATRGDNPPDEKGLVLVESTKHYPNIFHAVLLLLLLLALQLIGGLFFGIIQDIFSLFGLLLPESVGLIAVNSCSTAVVLALGVWIANAPLSEVCPFTAFPPGILLPLVVLLIGLGIIASEVDNITRLLLPIPGFFAEIMSLFEEEGFLMLIAVAVVAPLTEELLERGLILRGLLSHYSTRKAVVVSAVLFAVTHMNPYQLFSAFAAGILLAWLFIKTRSLLPCILAHSFYNTQGWIVQNLLKLDIPGYTYDGDIKELVEHTTVQFQPWWFDTLGIVLFSLGLSLLIRLFANADANESKTEPVE